MTITIAKAKVSEGRAIRALEDKVWHERMVTGKYDIGILIRFGYAFIAKDGKKIIGAIFGMKTKNNEVYVGDWFVDKKYQRKGVGKKLYTRIIKAANGLPIVSFLHPDSKESIRAHRELGFKVVQKVNDVYGLGDDVHRFLVRKK